MPQDAIFNTYPLCDENGQGSIRLVANVAAVTSAQIVRDGGGGAYNYIVGADTFVDDTYLAAPNGTYTATVNWLDGTTSTQTGITLNCTPVEADLLVSADLINPEGAALGTITVEVVGGTAPYIYQLNDGVFQASNIFTDVPVGTHTINVQDDLNASGTLEVTLVQQYRSTQEATAVCPTNYSGTSTESATAISIISQEDADTKATAAALLLAQATLVCELTLSFEDVAVEENSFTYSYSIEGSFWGFEHEYLPNAYLCNSKRIASCQDGRFFLHNQKDLPCVYYEGIPKDSYIDAVFAPRAESVLHSLSWDVMAYADNGKAKHELTFDQILIYNEDQCSGIVNLRKYKGLRDVHGVWRFHDFIDKVKDRDVPFIVKGKLDESNIKTKSAWFNDSLFIGKFFIVRYIHHNLTANNLYLYEVDASVSKSVR